MSTPISPTPPDRTRLHALVLAACVVLAAVHQYQVWEWFIEDAAITFAYARNWANGEGLVAWPGGERIEGYSNPTWMFLIAFFEWFGIDGFHSAKPLALLATAFCIVASWFVARRAMPDDNGDLALIAPVVLAAGSVFNMWAASGLENALFCAILIGGVWRQLVEMERGGPPVSALIFFLLAITRPEAILYAAVAGFWFLVATWRAGRGIKPVVLWVAAFWLPYLTFVAVRMWYFAWPLPMTYYAKVGTGGTVAYKWYGRGWLQVREFAANLWQGWFLPVYLLALLGTDRRWRWTKWVLFLGFAMMMWPGPEVVQNLPFWPDLPEPVEWIRFRIALIALATVALPLLAVGQKAWEARVLCWSMAATTVFFAVYSNGDWMRGFRWMSLHGPTSAVLFAVGAAEIGRLVARWTRAQGPNLAAAHTIPAMIVTTLALPANLWNTTWFADSGKNETPHVIRRRVSYTNWVGRRVFLDDQLVNLDMDMGAFLWWSDQWMVVMAGLVDVPIALHTYGDRAFIQEYVLEHRRPHLAHVHGHWERTSEFTAYSAFKRDWFEMPRWRDGSVRMHPGEYIRRDLVFQPQWPHSDDRKVNFAGGASLQGWHLPDPELSRGRSFYVEVGFKTWKRKKGEDYRVFAFIANDEQQSAWELPMAYEWLPMHRWRTDEVFVGRFALELPGHLEPGTYDLGFAVIGPGGRNLPAGGWQQEAHVAPGAVLPSHDEARFMRGEVRFPDAVQVVKYGRALDKADERLDETLRLADQGHCEAAEAQWTDAWRTVPKHAGFKRDNAPQVGSALSRCWSEQARASSMDQVELLQKAHRWDHRNATFLEVSAPVAETLWQAGLEARAAHRPEAAFRLFEQVLSIQPTNAWARRYAEEARNERLGLGPIRILGRMKRDFSKRDPAP